MKAKRICCHWICTARNAKRNSLVQKQMTAFGNVDRQEEIKNAGKWGTSKSLFSSNSFEIHLTN